MDIDPPLGLVLCVALLCVIFFFSACENAAVEWSDVKLKKLAKEDGRAERLADMLASPNRFLAVNLTARFVMVMTVTALSIYFFYAPLKKALAGAMGLGTGEWAVRCVSALTLICITALAVSTFGVIIPKRLCASGKIGEGFSLSASGVYKVLLSLFLPLELLSEALSRPLLRLAGVRNMTGLEAVTEEEILMMVDAVNETGALEESQAEMISNIFEFDDTEIREVMTHRTEVAAIAEDAPIKDAVELAIESGFSRIPVYKDTIDDIEGVIYAKDLLTLAFHESADGRTVKDFMREVVFVPESRKCGELFEEMTENKFQMAIAVDEYGGTAGVVTLEDLIETIVGSIQDEYDDETEEITQVSDNVFEIEGNTGYEDVCEALGLTPDEESPYETIGALVIDLLGRIPEDGETPSVNWAQGERTVRFNVLKAVDRRIELLSAELLPEETTADKT